MGSGLTGTTGQYQTSTKPTWKSNFTISRLRQQARLLMICLCVIVIVPSELCMLMVNHPQAFYVGDLYLMSNFIRSDFGDRKLFFKHTITEVTKKDKHANNRLLFHVKIICIADIIVSSYVLLSLPYVRRTSNSVLNSVLCPDESAPNCTPCPQTYNCFSQTWLPGLMTATASAYANQTNTSTDDVTATEVDVSSNPYLRYYLDPLYRATTLIPDATVVEKFDEGKSHV
jgi:hypothetical protein